MSSRLKDLTKHYCGKRDIDEYKIAFKKLLILLENELLSVAEDVAVDM